MAAALVCAAAFPLNAQQRPVPPLPPAAGPGTVVGVVVDTMGRPVDSVLVYRNIPRRDARTALDGTFRLNGMGDGSVVIGFRKVGFMPRSMQVFVAKGGASVRVEMIPVVRTLSEVRTEARRTGLSGQVVAPDGTPISGALVRLLGSGAGSTRSDSSGAFYIDGKAGRYMTQVDLDGHISELVSVTLDEKAGRHVRIVLRAGTRAVLARHAAYMDDLRRRLVMRRPNYSKLFTREDIDKINPVDPRQLATIGAIGRIDEACEVIIDGGMDKAPIWALDIETIEFMEVYQAAPYRRTVTSITGRPQLPTQRAGPGPCAGNTVWIWTRR